MEWEGIVDGIVFLERKERQIGHERIRVCLQDKEILS